MRYLLYRIKYRQFFLNIEGIKSFANRCINYYVSNGSAIKAQTLTSYVKVLKEELHKKKTDFAEYGKLDRMDNGSFALKKSKSKSIKFVVYVLIIFEIFLNYLSTLIFLQGDSFLLILARWAIAIILALITMLTVDGLLSKLLPEESVRIKGVNSQNEDAFYDRSAKFKRIISLILLPILLVALECAIFGVAQARALDIEGGSHGALYYGFILLSMALPIIAGYFKWDSEQHGKLYKNSEQYFKAENLIHILKLTITATMKDVKNIVDLSSLKAWQIFEQFKLYKENYNLKHNLPIENIDSHYCKSSQLFFEKALTLFGQEVAEILKEYQDLQKDESYINNSKL
jgi:hypothetical protein